MFRLVRFPTPTLTPTLPHPHSHTPTPTPLPHTFIPTPSSPPWTTPTRLEEAKEKQGAKSENLAAFRLSSNPPDVQKHVFFCFKQSTTINNNNQHYYFFHTTTHTHTQTSPPPLRPLPLTGFT